MEKQGSENQEKAVVLPEDKEKLEHVIKHDIDNKTDVLNI